jgi:hypothetical protein
VAGETANCAAPTPEPVSDTVAGSGAPTTVTDKLPVSAPEVVGANVMVIVEDCPGVSTIGNEGVLVLKAEPVVVTLENVTLAPPLGEALVRVMEFVLLPPTETFPKSILEELSVRFAAEVVPAAWLVWGIPPPHETLTRAATKTANAPSQ